MIKKVELDLGDGRILSLETGKVAREAGGAVIVRLGDTIILATATASSTPRANIDFFPLLVDFEEKLYAVGKIPGGFFKREGRPSEKAILTSRLVDRPIRPLFPKGFLNDVQIVITPLSVDQENPPDILAVIGASAALSISEVPFKGPIAATRVAKIDGNFLVNPKMDEMAKSSLDIVVAGTKDAIMMIEAGADQVSEEDIEEAIKRAHAEIKKIIKLQEELVNQVKPKKKEFELYPTSEKIISFVNKYRGKIEKAMNSTDQDLRKEELRLLGEEIVVQIKEGNDKELIDALEKRPFDVKNAIEEIEKETIRAKILNEGKRPDGRGLTEIRPIEREVGVLPRAHGSALFSRGQTQVLTVVTLGAKGEEQMIEGLDIEDTTKRYMHHYNFPAYSVGEVRPLRGPGRREIGHGALAERALLSVIPTVEEFPYTIRVVSEVLGSNGSTSMASTCGSTLALMDAGVKIDAPVAGISVGLVKDGNKAVMITDIQGLEDHFGDMDFKVAGTRKGITAIQLDIKIDGLSQELVAKALTQAKQGRFFILDKIQEIIDKPREDLSPFAPRVTAFSIPPEKIGMVIGPGGKNIKKIIEESGAQIDIEDSGNVFITSSDPEGAKKARAMIEDIAIEAKEGDVFLGKVVKIMPFGAFVEISGGKDGLIHISEISSHRIARVEDELSIGDEVYVKVVKVDEMGRINLTRKSVTPEDKAKLNK